MYAKLIDDALTIAPKKLNGEGVIVYNPPAEAPSGYYYESGWEEQTDAIMQTWTLTPLPDDIDDGEAYDIIFGGGGE